MNKLSTEDYLKTVITRIKQDKFGQRDAPVLHLSPCTVDIGGKGLRGTIEVSVRTRTGKDEIIHRENFDALKTHKEVDDIIAHILSTILMNHSGWPR